MNSDTDLSVDWQAYENWLQELTERKQIPGLAVRVFTGTEILFERGLGVRNREQDLPVTPDTIFGIASVTKSFTALSVLRAATQGDLLLDDPVTQWLPELTLWQNRAAPTVRQLLTQTSGLPALPTLVHAMAESTRGDPTEAFNPPPADLRPAGTTLEIIDYLNQEARVEEPGGVFCYQNDAWGLLGAIVSRASGLPFEDYLERFITGPLGLTRTGFDLERVLSDPDATTLYAADPDGNIVESPKWQDSKPLAGAGYLRSTARDLTSYVRFLMAGAGAQVGVSDALLQEMQSPLVWCGPDSSYGYGLTVTPNWRGLTLVSHGGRLKGVSSHIGFIPELRAGAVVLSNLEAQPAEMVWQGAINTLLDLPVDAPRYKPEPDEVEGADTEALLGEYRSGEPWGRLLIERSESGGLQVREGQESELHSAFLVSRSELGFRGEDQVSYVPILRDADGEIYGVHLGRRILYRV